MALFNTGKTRKDNTKKNFEKMNQSNLRFLSKPIVLLMIGLAMMFFVLVIANLLVYLFEGILPNLMRIISGEMTLNVLSFEFFRHLFLFKFEDYPFFYLLVFAFGFYHTIKKVFEIRTNFKPLEDDFSQGTMEWTPHKHLKRQYEIVPVVPFAEDDYFDGKPGLPISRLPRNLKEKVTKEFRYLVETFTGNMLILAATRIGKSRYFIDPFIDTISRAKNQEDRWSFVMSATKGTEPREWYNILKRRGYNIRIYNTVNQFYSDPFPILKIFMTYYKHYFSFRKQSEAETDKLSKQKYMIKGESQLANAENMLKRAAQSYFIEVNEGKDGGFWTKACRNLFMAVGLAVSEQVLENDEDEVKVNPYTIYDIANEMIADKISEKNIDYLEKIATSPAHLKRLLEKYDGSSTLDVFFQEAPRSHPGRKYYAAILASAPAKTTLGNVLTHFDGDLESFLQSATAKMTSWDDGYDIRDIGFDKTRPTAVFIIFSDSDELNNKLGMLIADQIYQVLKNEADLQDDPSNAHCVRPVINIWEEGGNLGVPIPRLAQKWTAGLSRWLYNCLVLQDIEQITEMYSEPVKKTILGNLANFVYIRTGSEDTNEFVAKQLGKRNVYQKSRMKDPTKTSATETESLDRIELLDPAELRRLRAGESVILRLNHEEDKDGNPIYQYPILNTFENDTNMIKFDEYRVKDTISWEDIPVNNQFMGMDIEDLLMTLSPIKRKDKRNKVAPPLPDVAERFVPRAVPTAPIEGIEQLTLFDLENQSSRPDKKGGAAMNKAELVTTEIMNQKIEQESQALEAKKDVLTDYLQIYQQDLENSISQTFNKVQLQQMTRLVRETFKARSVVINEFTQIAIVQDQTVSSLLTFLVSNGTQEFHEQLLRSMEKWKGVA